MNLPADDSAFTGSMYFTYVGCQSDDVGSISGNKTAGALSGTWSGSIDGQVESGTYSGTYNSATASYAGSYNHDGGRTFRDLRPCTQYHIAAFGSWEMFGVGANSPSDFAVTQANRTVSWTARSGGAYTLAYLLDPDVATKGGNPVLWQTVVTSGTSVVVPNSVVLASGKTYVVGVAVLNSGFQRLAFGSLQFVRP